MTSVLPIATSLPHAAEQTPMARTGGWMFRHRGVLPVPFIALVFLWHPSVAVAGSAFGALLVSLGEALRLWGVAAAGTETRRRSRAVTRLVAHGPFAWTRNPLYTGNLLIWTGFAVISGVRWFVPAAMLLFAVEYIPIVFYEEAVLEATFGEAYLRYKWRTCRWLPVAPAAQAGGPLHWGAAWRSERSTLAQFALMWMLLGVSRLAG